MTYPQLPSPSPIPPPPHWRREHDHFLIYYSHSPTLPPRIRHSEPAIYGELMQTFLFERPPSMLAVVQRIRLLAHAAPWVMPEVLARGYWWAHNHGANPWGG